MKEVIIDGNKYNFIKGYKDDDRIRKSFNELAMKTYGFDFEQWYQLGYWRNTYVPYSLMKDDKIIANVSASNIDFWVMSERKSYVQIGTVMTDLFYRNKGLSRYLMEQVIMEWKSKCDMIYLFANDSVLNFYPKFGFKEASQYQYYKKINNANEFTSAQKMDMTLKEARDMLEERIEAAVPISKIAMLKNIDIAMFYCTGFMKDNIYYLKKSDSIAVAEFVEDTLYLQDIFSNSKLDLDEIIEELAYNKINKVVLDFTPENTEGYLEKALDNSGTTLFVMRENEKPFENSKLMFPVLSHT